MIIGVSIGVCFIRPLTGSFPDAMFLAIIPVGTLLTLEEAYAAFKSKRYYLADIFKAVESNKPFLVVFEGDRTFVEILAGVSAAIIGIGLEEKRFANPWPVRLAFVIALLGCFLFLNLQGAKVSADRDDDNLHIVELQPGSQHLLLLVRCLVYWTFIYGIGYILFAKAG